MPSGEDFHGHHDFPATDRALAVVLHLWRAIVTNTHVATRNERRGRGAVQAHAAALLVVGHFPPGPLLIFLPLGLFPRMTFFRHKLGEVFHPIAWRLQVHWRCVLSTPCCRLTPIRIKTVLDNTHRPAQSPYPGNLSSTSSKNDPLWAPTVRTPPC